MTTDNLLLSDTHHDESTACQVKSILLHFTFLRSPPEQWKSIRTTNAIERLHEEFKRRIKTQCLLPRAATACMLFRALLAGGQISLRRVDGWDTFHIPPAEPNLDLAA